MYKQFISRIIMRTFILIAFIGSNLGFAENPGMSKLAEYDASELVTDVAVAVSSSSTIYKGQPYIVKLVKNNSQNEINLLTISFEKNYATTKTNELKLNSYLAADGDYDIVLGSNLNAMYLLIRSSENNYKDNKNLIFKSTDGIDWKLAKSFPAEWLLDDLEVHGKNLSLTCYNCEDERKPAYIISNNNGLTWHKYALPELADDSSFSGVSNNKLFAISSARDPKNRAKLIPTLYSNDLSTRHSAWVKSNISHLLETNHEYQSKQLQFQFSEINKIFDTEDALIALTTYEAVVDASDNQSVTKHFAWFSNDNGLTWNFVNVDLGDETITQISKVNNKYNIVTAKALDLILHVGDDGDINNPDALKDLLHFFYQQKYSFYQLTTEDLIHSEIVKPVPKYQMDHAMGFNLNYQTNYADALIVHNSENKLMFEFYRMSI